MKWIAKTLAATALIGATALPAQEAVPQAPQGMDHAGEVSAEYVSYLGDVPGQNVTADTRPLTGGQSIGFGSWGPRHSFLIPEFEMAEILDSNPLLTDHQAYRGFTSLGSSLQWNQYFGPNTLLRYTGAVRFDTRAVIEGERQFTNAHGLSLSKRIPLGPWGLLFDDEAQFSDGSNFGATGMEGLGPVITQVSQWGGAPNIQQESVSLQPGIVPDQSILTIRSRRISNTVLGEGDYRLDERTTLSATGYYGVLHFFTPGLIDTSQTGFVTGYNRALSPLDTVAIEYGRSQFAYSGSAYKLTSQYAGLLYARRISGHLAVVAGAGPQFAREEDPSGKTASPSWQGQGRIEFHQRSFDLAASAMRIVTGGAGVLFGARTSLLEADVQHALNRNWGTTMHFGVARSSAIVSPLGYSTQYAGASITHQLGRRAGIYLSYDFQHQTSSGASSCAAGTCALAGTRQVFGTGIRWSSGPIGTE